MRIQQLVYLEKIAEKGSINEAAKDLFLTQPSLSNAMKDLEQEHFVVLLLNSKNIVTKQAWVYKGTLNSSIIHPREVFNIAIRESSNSIIVVHNHPSGDVTPSKEDITTTYRLKECGDILGINLLDHIIIGDNKFTSLVEAGYFDK